MDSSRVNGPGQAFESTLPEAGGDRVGDPMGGAFASVAGSTRGLRAFTRLTASGSDGTHLGGGAKRSLDILGALAMLVLGIVVLPLVTLAIRLDSRGPALFAHERIGHGGRSFRCLKFRTMVPDSERVLSDLLARDPAAAEEWERGRKLREDPRITRVGRILRRTSLDEWPQAINILKGEMSLVGPRPITADETVHYGPAFADYVRTRPGLTGAWQVDGRSDCPYERRVALDRAYVRGWSFTGDLLILARTPAAVLGCRGSC